MKKYAAALALAMISSGILSGCAASWPQSQPLTRVETKTSSSKASMPSTQWKAVGDESFLLQGKIVGVRDGSGEHSLKLHIDAIIVPGPPRSSYPKFPYRVGTTVTVQFDRPFPSEGPMEPRIGEEVELGVRQYTTESHEQPFWGSTLSEYYYEKNGQFYDENETVVAVAV
jgi:hypothetical protein